MHDHHAFDAAHLGRAHQRDLRAEADQWRLGTAARAPASRHATSRKSFSPTRSRRASLMVGAATLGVLLSGSVALATSPPEVDPSLLSDILPEPVRAVVEDFGG